MSISRKYNGKLCHYCKRQMFLGSARLHPTRDHVIPRSTAPQTNEIVICCFDCNHIKDDMTPNEWLQFMQRNIQWWKLNDYTGTVWRAMYNKARYNK